MTFHELLRFRVNDQILCVIPNTNAASPLVKGQTYIVSHVEVSSSGNPSVRLVGDSSGGFNMMRFRLKIAHCTCGMNAIHFGCKCGASEREKFYDKLPRIIQIKNCKTTDPYKPGWIGFITNDNGTSLEVQMFYGSRDRFTMIPESHVEDCHEYEYFREYEDFIKKNPEYSPF